MSGDTQIIKMFSRIITVPPPLIVPRFSTKRQYKWGGSMFQIEGENFSTLKKKKARRFAAQIFLSCGFECISAVNGMVVKNCEIKMP